MATTTLTNAVYDFHPERECDADLLQPLPPQQDQEFTDEDFYYWSNSSAWRSLTAPDEGEIQGDAGNAADMSSLGESMVEFLSGIASQEGCDEELSFCSWVQNPQPYSETKTGGTTEIEVGSMLSLPSILAPPQEITPTTLMLEEDTTPCMTDQGQKQNSPSTIWCSTHHNEDDVVKSHQDPINYDGAMPSYHISAELNIGNTQKNAHIHGCQNDDIFFAHPTPFLQHVNNQTKNYFSLKSDNEKDDDRIPPTLNVVVLEPKTVSPVFIEDNAQKKDEEAPKIADRNKNEYGSFIEIDNVDAANESTQQQITATTATTKKGQVQTRSRQNEKWMSRYKALLKYREKYGNCNVPLQAVGKNQSHHEKEGLALSKWVKRQRHQYKLRSNGIHSHLTDDRIKLLEDIGFIWNSHSAAWEENYEALRDFRYRHGHCHVPIAEPRLSTWMKRQRRQYKMFIAGKSSTMTEERIDKLNKLGFIWCGAASN